MNDGLLVVKTDHLLPLQEDKQMGQIVEDKLNIAGQLVVGVMVGIALLANSYRTDFNM